MKLSSGSPKKQGLINKDQHDLRGGRSCCTQLLEVMKIWMKWFDLGLPWDTIYSDFSKVFDSVPRHRLLKKVQAYGIQGSLLRWIEHYLRDRKQKVILGSDTSEWKPVTSGIPRGSVLGPILFTMFINDMPETVSSMMKLFADDAQFFKAIESLDDISTIQNEIDKLLLNVYKYKCIHFGKHNPELEYTMGHCTLHKVPTKRTSVYFFTRLWSSEAI